MITPELAIKLKANGFPQYEDFVMASEEVTSRTAYNRFDHRTFDLSLMGYPKTEPDYYTQGKFRPSCIFSRQYLDSKEGKEETFYFPSLSELIEACGKDFPSLTRYEDHWRCEQYDSLPSGGDGGFIELSREATPEEAVANLWLTLNKKT